MGLFLLLVLGTSGTGCWMGGHIFETFLVTRLVDRLYMFFFFSSSYTYTSGVVESLLGGHDTALELACLSGILFLAYCGGTIYSVVCNLRMVGGWY